MRWLPDYFCLTGVAPAKEAPSPSLNRCSNGFNNLSTAKEVPRRTCAPLFFRALILEYLTSPYVPLTPSTLTPALARASLNALTTIHAALVLHNDFQSEQDDCYQFRNIMVAAGEKGEAEAQAVWIDFDHAEAYISKEATPKFTQYRLREEGFLVWDTFWNYILPAQGGVYYEPGRSIDNMSDWMKRRWRLCGERAKMGEEDKEDGGMRGKQYPAGCDSGQNE